MTAAQAQAFAAATGGHAPGEVALAIGAILITFALIWVAWSCHGLFHGWRNNALDAGELMRYSVRAAMVLLLLGWLVH